MNFQHNVYEKVYRELIFFIKFFEGHVVLFDKR